MIIITSSHCGAKNSRPSINAAQSAQISALFGKLTRFGHLRFARREHGPILNSILHPSSAAAPFIRTAEQQYLIIT